MPKSCKLWPDRVRVSRPRCPGRRIDPHQNLHPLATPEIDAWSGSAGVCSPYIAGLGVCPGLNPNPRLSPKLDPWPASLRVCSPCIAGLGICPEFLRGDGGHRQQDANGQCGKSSDQLAVCGVSHSWPRVIESHTCQRGPAFPQVCLSRLSLFFAGQGIPITACQQRNIMKLGAGSYATVTNVRFGSIADTQKSEKCRMADFRA